MGYKIDLTGKVIGRLTVIGYSHSTKNNGAYWLCSCICGKEKLISVSRLTNSTTKSCGCIQIEATKNLAKHKMHNTPIYRRWASMKNRCSSPSSTIFSVYGGRGISYSPEWESFENFYRDMYEGFSENLELDRIDVNGNYCKENCRWVTHEENNFNKTRQQNNKSGKTGVSFDKARKQWRAYINKNKVRIELGYFDSFNDAVEVRVLEELELYGYVRNDS